MDDIWRASDPDLPADSMVLWRDRPVPPLHLFWWLAFVASQLLGWGPITALASVAVIDTIGVSATESTQFGVDVALEVVVSALSALAAVSAIMVMSATTTRQEERVERLLSESDWR